MQMKVMTLLITAWPCPQDMSTLRVTPHCIQAVAHQTTTQQIPCQSTVTNPHAREHNLVPFDTPCRLSHLNGCVHNLKFVVLCVGLFVLAGLNTDPRTHKNRKLRTGTSPSRAASLEEVMYKNIRQINAHTYSTCLQISGWAQTYFPVIYKHLIETQNSSSTFSHRQQITALLSCYWRISTVSFRANCTLSAEYETFTSFND